MAIPTPAARIVADVAGLAALCYKVGMNPERNLEGRFAVVTGSTRGIGRAMAEILARHGCNVAVSSRKRADSEEAASAIARGHAVSALGTPCDVSDQRAVHAFFGAVREWCAGELDILVCNAGFPMRSEIWRTPLHATPAEKIEDWYLNLFRTDTMGSVYATFEALPIFMPRRRGNIVYVSSIPALAGFQGTPYTVAKAGILGLMKEVAVEYGRYNIRANALALGNIRTPATYDLLDVGTRQQFAEQAPLGRWGAPEEVGNAMLFLASDQSSFITGQTLVVDGGVVRW